MYKNCTVLKLYKNCTVLKLYKNCTVYKLYKFYTLLTGHLPVESMTLLKGSMTLLKSIELVKLSTELCTGYTWHTFKVDKLLISC